MRLLIRSEDNKIYLSCYIFSYVFSLPRNNKDDLEDLMLLVNNIGYKLEYIEKLSDGSIAKIMLINTGNSFIIKYKLSESIGVNIEINKNYYLTFKTQIISYYRNINEDLYLSIYVPINKKKCGINISTNNKLCFYIDNSFLRTSLIIEDEEMISYILDKKDIIFDNYQGFLFNFCDNDRGTQINFYNNESSIFMIDYALMHITQNTGYFKQRLLEYNFYSI